MGSFDLEEVMLGEQGDVCVLELDATMPCMG